MNTKTKEVSQITYMQSNRWMDQNLADKIKWFESFGAFKTPKEKEAYIAGFKQAWGELFNDLRLHNCIDYLEVK